MSRFALSLALLSFGLLLNSCNKYEGYLEDPDHKFARRMNGTYDIEMIVYSNGQSVDGGQNYYYNHDTLYPEGFIKMDRQEEADSEFTFNINGDEQIVTGTMTYNGEKSKVTFTNGESIRAFNGWQYLPIFFDDFKEGKSCIMRTGMGSWDSSEQTTVRIHLKS